MQHIVRIALVASAFLGMASTAPSVEAASRSCLPASLKSILAKVERRFGRVSVISTHRPGATIRGSGKRSYHASCRAADFKPPRGKYRAVVNFLRANHRGGLGTYSGRHNHIHIDNGPRYRFHRTN
ncbi:MAG: D-Ala-D-Ala carboxypeptidase family metallohydrolase [Pseudomonadota bacterium]